MVKIFCTSLIFVSTLAFGACESYPDKGYVVCTDGDKKVLWENGSNSFKGSYDQAQKYCENLKIDGMSGWIIPSIGEFLRNAYDMVAMQSDTEDPNYYSSLYFKAVAFAPYWTSTYDEYNSGSGGSSNFAVDMNKWFSVLPATVEGFDGKDEYYVRCFKDLSAEK